MADFANGGYTSMETSTTHPNFLGSEIGLIQKTCQVPVSLGVQDGKYKIAAAGTVFPANDATAEGILFEDVNVTNGDKVGSIITSGHVLSEYLPVSPSAEAKTALNAKGIYFDD